MFSMVFSTDNEAFEDSPREEIARILNEIGSEIKCGRNSGTVYDINGNRIGEYDYEEDEE